MTLPPLPPDVHQTIAIAADAIAAALAQAGLPLVRADGAPSPELYSVLYLLKLLVLDAPDIERPPDQRYPIALREIAVVLETIGQVMISEGMADWAGYNASWYADAADMVERAEMDMERQLAKIEVLLRKGLGT